MKLINKFMNFAWRLLARITVLILPLAAHSGEHETLSSGTLVNNIISNNVGGIVSVTVAETLAVSCTSPNTVTFLSDGSVLSEGFFTTFLTARSAGLKVVIKYDHDTITNACSLIWVKAID